MVLGESCAFKRAAAPSQFPPFPHHKLFWLDAVFISAFLFRMWCQEIPRFRTCRAGGGGGSGGRVVSVECSRRGSAQAAARPFHREPPRRPRGGAAVLGCPPPHLTYILRPFPGFLWKTLRVGHLNQAGPVVSRDAGTAPAALHVPGVSIKPAAHPHADFLHALKPVV